MQEYSEGSWPLSDMMGAFPDGWNEIVQEMLQPNECDICGPPLDIGPPPPLPANFQDRADILPSGNCNICHLLIDVEMRPSQLAETSLLPIMSTLFVGMVLIVITLVVLVLKVKKCRSFFPRSLCWLFPRNLLPHTELAPSSLPSPSPSTEKLKGNAKPWNGSTRSLQSENIYEVCSPPSQDSLYEEVGPPPLIKGCSPYGVVLMEKSPRELYGKNSRVLFEPSFPYGVDAMQSQQKSIFVGGMPVPHFSTFGGSGRGFFNPVVREGVGSGSLLYTGSSHTLGSCHAPNRITTHQNPMQKRKLPPVPADGANISL